MLGGLILFLAVVRQLPQLFAEEIQQAQLVYDSSLRNRISKVMHDVPRPQLCVLRGCQKTQDQLPLMSLLLRMILKLFRKSFLLQEKTSTCASKTCFLYLLCFALF